MPIVEINDDDDDYDGLLAPWPSNLDMILVYFTCSGNTISFPNEEGVNASDTTGFVAGLELKYIYIERERDILYTSVYTISKARIIYTIIYVYIYICYILFIFFMIH